MMLATVAVLIWLTGYASLCAVQPFAPCRKCNGIGYLPTGRRGRKPCKRCRGHGRRLRRGRRAFTASRRLHRDGTH